MVTKQKIAKNRYSISRAYGMVPLSKAKAAKRDLMEALGMESDGSWRNMLSRGYLSPRLDKYIKVNRVFRKYGITDAWEEIKA